MHTRSATWPTNAASIDGSASCLTSEADLGNGRRWCATLAPAVHLDFVVRRFAHWQVSRAVNAVPSGLGRSTRSRRTIKSRQCGCRPTAGPQPSKLLMPVRVRSPAPILGVAQPGQSACLGSTRPLVRIQPSRPVCRRGDRGRHVRLKSGRALIVTERRHQFDAGRLGAQRGS